MCGQYLVGTHEPGHSFSPLLSLASVSRLEREGLGLLISEAPLTLPDPTLGLGKGL